MGEVDAVEHTEERVLTLNAWIGGRKGCASTADFSERSLEAAVQAAVDIARVSAEDPAAGLPEAEDLQADMRDLSHWHPFQGERAGAVRPLRRRRPSRRTRISCDSDGTNFYDLRRGSSRWPVVARALRWLQVFASRHGRWPLPSSSRALRRDAGGRRGAPSRIFWTPPSSDTQAGRTVARLGARPLSSRRARVLLMRPWRRDLLDILKSWLNGRAWYRHADCLGRLGQQILLLMSPWRRIPIS